MRRRRFDPRFKHSDSVLMMLAVLVATAFCWVVLAFARSRPQPAVAYTVEAPGLRLSAIAAGQLIRDLSGSNPTSRLTLVHDRSGISLGVTPRGPSVAQRADARALADRAAERIRSTEWSQVDGYRQEEIAEELYGIDVRIRDAATRRPATGSPDSNPRSGAAAEVARLLQRRGELVAERRRLLEGDAVIPQVVVHQHDRPQLSRTEQWLAVGVFGLLVAAAVHRLAREPRVCDPARRWAYAAGATVIRLSRADKTTTAIDADEHLEPSPGRAAA